MKRVRTLIFLLLVASIVIAMLGCENANKDVSDNNTKEPLTEAELEDKGPVKEIKEVIELPFLYTNAGNDSQYELNNYYFDNFNAEFEGKYKIVVEWLPGMAEDIRAKLKMLNASGDLPAFVTQLGAEPAFADLLIKNNRLMDLKPYFDASPEWQEVCILESIEYNTTEDGKMYTTPAVTASYVGMFYNKEHFANAGIEEFPETWDEFWNACEALKKAGHIPISLHTTETGWCPMLVATSSFALSDDGKKFIEQKYPTNFNEPVVIDAMTKLRKLFDFTTKDAVGGKYALAANNFCAGNTSMIPNGPWMIASLSDPEFSPEGFEEKVGYAPYPGGVMLSNQGEAYGNGVSMDHPLEVQEGVVEWIKFLARPENIRKDGVVQGNFSQIVQLTDSDVDELSPAMQEYVKAISQIKQTVQIYQNQWDPITQNEVIPAEMPSLVTDGISVEEFCAKMSESGKRYEEENNN